MTLLLRGALAAVLLVLLAGPAPAAAAPGGLDDPADQWLPRSDGAEWVYPWSNSDYSPTPRNERYVVQSRSGTAFRLRWDEQGAGVYDTPQRGTMDFQPHRRRARQPQLPEHAAAAAVPDPLRQRERLRQQRRRRAVHADLGHALADARRAAAARHALELARRRRQRRRQRNRYLGHEKVGRAGVPGGRRRRRRSSRRSRRRGRSATRSAAACAPSGGSAASAR